MVKFQLDSGATCNLLPAKYLEDKKELTPTRKRLTMYNNTMIKPLGTCKMDVCNPKNARSYHVEFVVVDSDRAILNLGNQTMQQISSLDNSWLSWLEEIPVVARGSCSLETQAEQDSALVLER